MAIVAGDITRRTSWNIIDKSGYSGYSGARVNASFIYAIGCLSRTVGCRAVRIPDTLTGSTISVQSRFDRSIDIWRSDLFHPRSCRWTKCASSHVSSKAVHRYQLMAVHITHNTAVASEGQSDILSRPGGNASRPSSALGHSSIRCSFVSSPWYLSRYMQMDRPSIIPRR